MKSKLPIALAVFGLWIALAFLPLVAMYIGEQANVPVRQVLHDHPGIILAFLGVWLWLFSAILFVFRDELGMWSAQFRRRLAEKHPWWKKMAGLSDEKVEYYLSLEFSRKLIVVGAVIAFVLGAAFVLIGIATSM